MSGPRIIIFSERIATVRFLQEQLCADLGLSTEEVVQFHAGLPDVEQQRIVEDFGKADSPMRILVASDVASEGVNLHYFCHLMVHFDIPWSLITLEQRNGRIDRYGQHEPPLIHYLLTISQNETIRGDLHILDKLIEKEEEAHKNIGDAATILGLHDAQKEEAYITQAVAEARDVDEILPELSPEASWLDLLRMAQGELNGESEDDTDDDPRADGFSLYPDDLRFAQAAFEELLAAKQVDQAPEYHPDRPEFSLLAPEDLRRRCAFMPDEAVPADWIFRLTTDRQRVMQAMADARRRQNEWPQEQLFWDIHPVSEWLMDKLMVQFGRHEAPIILTPHLDPKECIFLFQGIVSNQRGQPLIAEWFGRLWDRNESGWTDLTLAEVLTYTEFAQGIPNTGRKSARVDEITALLPAAVDEARSHMKELRIKRGNDLGAQLRDDMRRLRQWLQDTEERIQYQRTTAIGARAARLDHELDEARKRYAQRERWLNDTLKADPTPYLRVAATFTGS